jgi:hypothetical protein
MTAHLRSDQRQSIDALSAILPRCDVNPISAIGDGVDACDEVLASGEDSVTVSVLA